MITHSSPVTGIPVSDERCVRGTSFPVMVISGDGNGHGDGHGTGNVPRFVVEMGRGKNPSIYVREMFACVCMCVCKGGEGLGTVCLGRGRAGERGCVPSKGKGRHVKNNL